MSLGSWVKRKAAEKVESRVTSDFDTPEKAQAYAERLMEGPMNPWLHSLIVAAVGGASTAAVQLISDPAVLFAPGGWKRIAATSLAGGLVAIVAFLKKSPVPAMKESLVGPPPEDGAR